ncbi:MAG: PAS domain S-box protein [Zavarzinia sp.]|nr:PAS domain S-box protein [Zavarzinia sp.]
MMPSPESGNAEIRLSTGFDSRILSVSPAFSAITGWPAAEASGQTLAILFGPWSDRATVEQLTRAVERGETLEAQPIKLYNHAGSAFDALVEVTSDGAGGAICVVKGTEGSAPGLVKIQGQAMHAVVPPSPDRVLPVLIEAQRDGVIVVDDADHISMANQAFLRLVGMTREELTGQLISAIAELRFPPGDSDGSMGAATLLTPQALATSAAVSMGRGVDNRGHGFRVLSFRASASVAHGGHRQTDPLEARPEVFEATLLRRVGIDQHPACVGLLEIVAAEDMAADLGSIWRDTLERLRITAAAALAGELQPGELFLPVRSDVFVVLLSGTPSLGFAIDRMQAIAQLTRHRLVDEGGALASFEVFGGALLFDAADPALAPGREAGALALGLADRIRVDQNSGYRTDSVVADILDEGTAVQHPVRSRDLGPARQTLARFDERSTRWLAWLARRHRLTPAMEREFDVALLGRVVESLHQGAAQAGGVIVPLQYQSLLHGQTADRVTTLVSSLPLQARVRLGGLVRESPPDLEGERLFAFLRRVAGVGRGVWLVLDALDARGITGRQEGLLGVAFDHARLNPMIERDPMRVKQFIERLRAANQPVLVYGVERPEQATLLFNTFSVTLVEGQGCERLAATPRLAPGLI